jgi:hypothetical protein
MSMRHKHLAEWSAVHGGRRRFQRPPSSRDSAAPRAFTVVAAAARFVERATRRNGL